MKFIVITSTNRNETEITSTNRNATEHISEKYKTNPVEHNQMCFYRGGGGTIGGK